MFTPRVSTPTSSAPNPFGQFRRENNTIDPEECPEGDFLQPEDHYLEIGYWMKSFERNKLNGVCKFCHSIAKGNITRMKGHFTGEGSVSRLCPAKSSKIANEAFLAYKQEKDNSEETVQKSVRRIQIQYLTRLLQQV